MKIIAIGDTHGRNYWEKFVEKEIDADKIVFIGDYFDSRDVTVTEQIANFKNILQYKRANLEQVVLLIGNHDYHYLRNIEERYSGFKTEAYLEKQILLEEAITDGLMQMCYTYMYSIFTHAGVSATWLMNNGYHYDRHIDTYINELFLKNRNAFNFNNNIGDTLSNTGDDIEQSPIWIRPDSLKKVGVKGYRQIVGHTSFEKITTDRDYIFIDCLSFRKDYLTINT